MDEETDEPHVYIYIYNRNNPGGKGTRKIVAATCLKKFNYEHYIQDSEKYKDTAFKLREGQPGQDVCYVLYAAGTYDLVNEHVSKSTKRFHIPNLDLSNVVDKSTTKDNNGEMHDETIEEVTNTKKSRKRQKIEKRQITKETSASIIQKYIQDQEDENLSLQTDPENAEEDRASNPSSSSFLLQNLVPRQPSIERQPLNDVSHDTLNKTPATTSTENYEAACNAYKMQMLYYKKKYEESKSKAEDLPRMQSHDEFLTFMFTIACFKSVPRRQS